MTSAPDGPDGIPVSLSALLGALLCDLAKAQDLSNRFSLALARRYQEDPLLSAFPVPNGRLEEVGLDLLLATDGVHTQTLGAEDLEDFLNQALLAPADRVAEDLRRALSEVLVAHASGSPRLQALLDGIQQPSWSQFMASRIRKDLESHLADAGPAEAAPAIEAMVHSLLEQILNHEEIQHLDLSAAAREDLQSHLRAMVPTWTRRLSQELEQTCARVSPPGLRVHPVATSSAAGLTLHLKAGMRTFTWVLQGEPDGSGQISPRGVLTLDERG